MRCDVCKYVRAETAKLVEGYRERVSGVTIITLFRLRNDAACLERIKAFVCGICEGRYPA